MSQAETSDDRVVFWVNGIKLYMDELYREISAIGKLGDEFSTLELYSLSSECYQARGHLKNIYNELKSWEVFPPDEAFKETKK